MQGAAFVVDNTFSPMIMTPAKWGADVVVHSMTKFMSGASDIVAGTHPCLRVVIQIVAAFNSQSGHEVSAWL